MKKINLFLLTICFPVILNAQAPQAISYQAVARNAQGQIIPAQNIGVRFSILDGSVTGTVLYEETHSTTTNNFGLFTLSIGMGSPVSGTFSTISWSGDKFLKVEIAPEGGTSYLLEGTTQLLSVPYALYAEKTHLIAGNAINITNGNTIAATYTGTNGVAVSGSTISGNYQAGTGINITGSTISATNLSQWINHANGIYYPSTGSSGNVGVRSTPSSNTALYVNGSVPGVLEGNAATFTSSSSWHTQYTLENSASSSFFTFVVGGPGNTEVYTKNFGIYNGNTVSWPITINALNNYVGIGETSIHASPARSSLHIKTGDIFIEQITSGIIMKSPDGQCWRITIDNSGNLVRTAITCP